MTHQRYAYRKPDMESCTINISEIFHTLQGEGPWIGMPSVFIRLGGCIAPYCPWCDTSFAWEDYTERTIIEILDEVKRYPCRRIVITGGEPFLQWESGLRTLHDELFSRGYVIGYETSGKTGIPKIETAMIVCSPKYIDGSWRIDPGCLGNADFFKFLFVDAGMSEDILDFISRNSIPGEKVFIMPEGPVGAVQLERMKSCFEFCRHNQFRMTPRLHTLIFDDTRGV